MPPKANERPSRPGTTVAKITVTRIGLISDTHIPADARMLPPHVREAFQNVDLILHAGDIYVSRILDELETIAPVLASRGNDDAEFPGDPRFSDHHVLNINGLRLGVTHRGYDPVLSGHPLNDIMEREFRQAVDVIVYGDTHIALVERYNGVLLVNPGSPTVPNGLLELGTVGILEITGTHAEARIVKLSELPLPFQRELIYY